MPQWTTLQNVVFSDDRDPDVLPLYADPETWVKIGKKKTVRTSANAHIDDILSRTTIRIPAGRRSSFASYFNAFPAAYWQHWTKVRSVQLALTTSGPGTVLVYRSNAMGIQQRVESRDVSGDAETLIDLPITQFGDGGWYWFDLVASDKELVLERGAWRTDAEPVEQGKVSLGITTFNKPDYCMTTLRALASHQDVLDVIDTVFLVDQGNQKVSDQDGFDEVSSSLGTQLTVINQGNLGGSGGFARSMAEAIEREDTGYLMLLDDDVKIEPESILRAVRFARFCSTPTIVGGHMFDLLDRPVLHAFAEIVESNLFLWRPLSDEQIRHDFRTGNLRQTPWMHQRMDADYNGWWMCLIPTSVIRKLGLALPVFIKWDDSEYGLRAREAGVPTVSMPGVALWHISWIDKDDALDWQAYFHARNRFVAALLHSPFEKGGRLVSNSRRLDLKHLLSMQYYAVELRHRGLRDLLKGPHHLHADLPKKLGELRGVASEFTETKIYKVDEDAPSAIRGKQVFPTKMEKSPSGPRLALFTLLSARRHFMQQVPKDAVERPQVELSKRDATWWRVPRYDSALISTADGTGKSVFRRDRAQFRKLWRESLRLHREIEKRWPELSRRYREALPAITSVEEWRKTFDR